MNIFRLFASFETANLCGECIQKGFWMWVLILPIFLGRFEEFTSRPSTYFIVVLEDLPLRKVIGCATLLVELKMIHNRSKVWKLFFKTLNSVVTLRTLLLMKLTVAKVLGDCKYSDLNAPITRVLPLANSLRARQKPQLWLHLLLLFITLNCPCKIWSFVIFSFCRLVSVLIEVGRSQGCYKISLDCDSDKVAFYERNGFKQETVSMCVRLSH